MIHTTVTLRETRVVYNTDVKTIQVLLGFPYSLLEPGLYMGHL